MTWTRATLPVALALAVLLSGCGAPPTATDTAKAAQRELPGGPRAESSGENLAAAGGEALAEPAGGWTPEKLAELADVPLYPNSSAPDGRTRKPYRDPNGAVRSELVLMTGDPAAKVAGWYLTNLKGFQRIGGGEDAQIMGKTPKGNLAIVKVTREAGKTAVRISSIQDIAGGDRSQD